jgi:hypothetical protein
VAVDGTGLERRIGTCRIDRSGRIRFGGIRLGAFLRNGILPGWGSVYAERKAVGLTDGLMLGASLYALYTADQDYRHLRNRFDTLSDLLAGAGTLDEIRRIQEAAYEASRDVNTQNAHRTRLVYLSAFLYGHQVLEPFLAGNPPRMESKAEGNVVEVASGASTRFKAFVYSMLRPGRGQFYQGKTTRGVLFSTMSTVAAFLALDFHNRYDEGVVDYELAVARYDAAATVGEKVRWSEAAATAWDDIETEKHRRDAAYITLAGLWGLSLADALIPGGGGTGAGRYAFDVGCGGCALVMRF